jgi:hypothetical protein
MTARSTRTRLVSLSAATLLAAGAVIGLAGCDADAQTPYPERTSSGTPVAPDDDITPSPFQSSTPTPAESDFPTPAPTSSDDSGTLDG